MSLFWIIQLKWSFIKKLDKKQEKLVELISKIYSSSSADNVFIWFYSCFMQVTDNFAPIKDYNRVESEKPKWFDKKLKYIF